VTPSVAVPADTNPRDVTAQLKRLFVHRQNILIRSMLGSRRELSNWNFCSIFRIESQCQLAATKREFVTFSCEIRLCTSLR